MNFANVKSLTIPEGSVYQIISGSTVLWTKPSTPGPERRLLYLMNGNNNSNTKQYDYGIDTGITWRDVFVNSASLGIEYPGLETVITYMYSWVPPEGGLIAGCNPRENGSQGRDMGGFWRIFGHGGANFCFDCPSEDDRIEVSGQMVANRIYTETVKYGYLGTNELRSYLKVEYEGTVQGDNTTSPSYSWTQASNPHNLYLWADLSTDAGFGQDTAPRGGVRIYGFTAWYLEYGERHTKIYEGVPWMDANNVPCIKDLVSGQLQYNAGSGTFLYGEIQ